MATFVLVHGGGHGGWCWDRVAPLLRERGHIVHAPTLVGVSERRGEATPNLDLGTHVGEVVDLLERLDLTAVVLVGHSYAGMVITGVADRVPERIARLVYLDAAIPADGEALLDTSPGLAAFAARDRHTIDGVDWVLSPEVMVGTVYGLHKPDDVAFAADRLSRHPLRTLTQSLHLRDPARVAAIPRAIINCTRTLASRPDPTRGRWLTGDPVFTIDAAHDVMITEPGRVAEMLLAIAAPTA